MRTAGGALVTVVTFLGPVRYSYTTAAQTPAPAVPGLMRAGPAVTSTERPKIAGAEARIETVRGVGCRIIAS